MDSLKQVRNFSVIYEKKTTEFHFLNFCSIENPKTKVKYDKINEFIEFLSKLITFAVLFVAPVAVGLPTIAITAINWFVYDLGDESFFFSTPIA